MENSAPSAGDLRRIAAEAKSHHLQQLCEQLCHGWTATWFADQPLKRTFNSRFLREGFFLP